MSETQEDSSKFQSQENEFRSHLKYNLVIMKLYLMVGHGSLSPLARVSGEAWTEQLSCPWHRSSTVRMASSIKHFS